MKFLFFLIFVLGALAPHPSNALADEATFTCASPSGSRLPHARVWLEATGARDARLFVRIVRLLGVETNWYEDFTVERSEGGETIRYADGQLSREGPDRARLEHFDGYLTLGFELACE